MRRFVGLMLALVLTIGAAPAAGVELDGLAGGDGVAGGSAVAAASGTGHPRLLFDAADAAGLQAKASAGVPAQAWAKLKVKVDSYTDPAHPNYVSPAIVRDPTPLANPDWNYYDGFFGQNQMATYLKDLGLAYVISGDARYGRHAAELMVALSDGWPNWTRRELGEGDLATGYGLAFDWVYDQFTAGERSTIVSSVVAELPDPSNPAFESGLFFRCLDADRPFSNNNWVAICGGGEGLMLMALAGEPGMPSDLSPWLGVARQRVLDHWQIYGAGGDNAEGVTYMAYAMKSAAPFVLAWERETGEDLTTFNPGVIEVAEWVAYEQLPGRGTRFVPRNDSSETMPLMHEVLGWYLGLRPDGLSAWVWDHTVGPDGDAVFTSEPVFIAHSTTANNTCTDVTKDPTRLLFCWRSPEVTALLYYQDATALPRTSPETVIDAGRSYPEWGLVTARTGWDDGEGEVALVYEAKHDHPGGHLQSDIGHFSLYGYGARWALDTGYGHNYSCTDAHRPVQGCWSQNPRMDNGRAVGHNVPLIEGNPFTQAEGAVFRSNDSITGFWDVPGATVVTSDLRHAYAADLSSIPLAERDLIFGRGQGEPVLLAVADRLQTAAGAQRYHWRMHTEAANAPVVSGHDFTLTAPNGAKGAGAVSDAFGQRFLYLLPWDNSRYSPFDNAHAQLVFASQDDQGLNGFRPALGHLAVLALTKPGQAAATVNRLDGCQQCNAVRVAWAGREILLGSTRHDVGLIDHTRLDSDGRLVKVSLDHVETVLIEGTTLVADGRAYVTVTGGPATVVASGGEIVADGPAGATYAVWSPADPTSVTVNGAPVAWTRSGDVVHFS